MESGQNSAPGSTLSIHTISATVFTNSGFRKGDKIITVSANRPEWNFADMGMSMIGVVHVPVFTSLSATEYDYIIRNSGARMVIISDKKLYKTIDPGIVRQHHYCKGLYI
ncbi:MAG: AMP-binding protein [Marinilabiliales bacterium]|nr:AMP-binding protein [Marinilabiliales bacterium]